MDNPILVNESKEAGLSLMQLVNRDHPVRVAFWLKTFDEPNWLHYIGGDWVKHTYSKDAYGVVKQNGVIHHFSVRNGQGFKPSIQ